MQLGMIGLGRMGANMVRRLLRDGHECVVYGRKADAFAELAKEGAIVLDAHRSPWTRTEGSADTTHEEGEARSESAMGEGAHGVDEATVFRSRRRAKRGGFTGARVQQERQHQKRRQSDQDRAGGGRAMHSQTLARNALRIGSARSRLLFTRFRDPRGVIPLARSRELREHGPEIRESPD